MIFRPQRSIARSCRTSLVVFAISLIGTMLPSFAQSNIFEQSPQSAFLSELENERKRNAVTGYATTMVMKFQAISRYYSFPVNVLMASAAEINGSEEEKLDHAIEMAQDLSLAYLCHPGALHRRASAAIVHRTVCAS